MNKLVYFRAASRRAPVAPDICRDTPLTCVWTRDPARDRLVCHWRPASCGRDAASDRPPSCLAA